MADMLVNLYSIPTNSEKQYEAVQIRRSLPPEKNIVTKWVREHFSDKWASECEVACSVTPSNCLVAIKDNEIVGFACFDTTFKNFFGPTGVNEAARGQGIGYQLLIASLNEMKQKGYAYAIIGDAGPVDFYKKAIGAISIENTPILESINML